MTITLSSIPASLDEMKAMPEAAFDTPYKTAALYFAAICNYHSDKDLCIEMLNFIRGPQEPLSQMQQLFIRDRMSDKADYIGKSYFMGATPQNNYTPAIPYTLNFVDNPYSFSQEGYALLYVANGGSDNPRPVKLRQKGSQWFLWDYAGTLAGIRIPAAQDLWA